MSEDERDAGESGGNVDGAKVAPMDDAARGRIPVAMRIAGASAVAALAIAGAAHLFGAGGDEVPSVVGLSESDAKATLRVAGFDVKEETRVVESDEAVGMVLDVSPGEGTRLPGDSSVTITVGDRRHVPDVVGEPEDDARDRLDDDGYDVSTTVAYYPDPEWDGKVLMTSPSKDEVSKQGQRVSVVVASKYPQNMWHIADYLTADPKALSEYLRNGASTLVEGYEYGGEDDPGHGAAGGRKAFLRYDMGGDTAITFTSTPWSDAHGDGPKHDVLRDGVGFDAVRIDFGDQMLIGISGTAEKDAQSMMSKCGLTGMTDFCTETDVAPIDGAKDKLPSQFVCAVGEQGTDAWSVMIRRAGDGRLSATVMCGPKSLFDGLSGETPLCDWLACVESGAEASEVAGPPAPTR